MKISSSDKDNTSKDVTLQFIEDRQPTSLHYQTFDQRSNSRLNNFTNSNITAAVFARSAISVYKVSVRICKHLTTSITSATFNPV